MAIEAFDAHGLRGQNERMLDVGDIVTILGSLYETIAVSIHTHRSQIGRYKYLNCSMKVVYYIFTSTPGVVRTHFWTNPRIQVF